jgi:hypothetical protein
MIIIKVMTSHSARCAAISKSAPPRIPCRCLGQKLMTLKPLDNQFRSFAFDFFTTKVWFHASYFLFNRALNCRWANAYPNLTIIIY